MAVYYNENDPKTAAWLRELIKQGHLPKGDVDERSIEDVKPAELTGYSQCHFFAGIGGWPLALKLAGWPDDRPVWTGSCPCQPYSQAGARAGADDPRNLWWTFRWLIDQCRPPTVFGEQVASKAGREWLSGVRLDMERMEYAVGAADLCAAGAGEKTKGRVHWEDRPGEFEWQNIVIGAPHIRQRIFWVADAEGGKRGLPKEQKGQEMLESVGCGKAGGVADAGCISNEFNGYEMGGAPEKVQRKTWKQRLWSNFGNGSDIGRMEHTAGQGLSRQSLGLLGSSDQGYWSDFDILHCTDGKARRIEPGSFPLAHGVPARVVRLRGYGNAIVPQVAAEFIGTYLDV